MAPLARGGAPAVGADDQSGKGKPFRYAAGIAFAATDEAAIRAFIARHAPGQ